MTPDLLSPKATTTTAIALEISAMVSTGIHQKQHQLHHTSGHHRHHHQRIVVHLRQHHRCHHLHGPTLSSPSPTTTRVITGRDKRYHDQDHDPTNQNHLNSGNYSTRIATITQTTLQLKYDNKHNQSDVRRTAAKVATRIQAKSYSSRRETSSVKLKSETAAATKT